MTTISVLEPGARATAAPSPTPAARVWRIVRLHYANRGSSIVVPLTVAAAIFAVYLTVGCLVAYATRDSSDNTPQYSTSLIYFLPYQVVFAVQAMNLTFSYALGMSSTRRDFSFGTWLMFLIQSASFAVIFTVLSYLEQWTHGWGIGVQIFQTFIYGTGDVGERLLTFFAGILVMQCVGSVFGAVFVRWRMYGMYLLGGAFLVALVGAAALITFTNSWLPVGHWFSTVGPTGFAAWLLAPAALFAAIGHLALRRATPKS